jgi:hypothetical protein
VNKRFHVVQILHISVTCRTFSLYLFVSDNRFLQETSNNNIVLFSLFRYYTLCNLQKNIIVIA